MSNHRLCECLAGGHGGGGAPPCRVLQPRGGGGEEGGARLVGPSQVPREGEEGTCPPHDSGHPGSLTRKGNRVGFITSVADWSYRFVVALLLSLVCRQVRIGPTFTNTSPDSPDSPDLFSTNAALTFNTFENETKFDKILSTIYICPNYAECKISFCQTRAMTKHFSWCFAK